MDKRVLLIVLVCIWILTSCQVLINPESNIIIKDSDGNIIENKTGVYDFGELLINTSTSARFTIENLGKKDLHLTGLPIIEFSGLDASWFSVITQPDTIIRANNSTTFEIACTPAEAEFIFVFVSIANSDDDQHPYSFTLGGNCAIPEIRVKQDQTTIQPGTGIFDFGSINIGETSASVVFTIQNYGTGNLYLSGIPKIQIAGNDSSMFLVDQSSVSSTIKAENSTQFTISFNPFFSGLKHAVISIENNSLNNNPYTFTITGTGFATPKINVQDSSLNNISNGSGQFDFGDQLINFPLPKTFVIQNLGSAVLQLTNNPKVAITGTDANAFSVLIQPSSQISPGFTSTFTIEFTPTTDRVYSASISIKNNDFDKNPYTFTITGTGISPEINVKNSKLVDIPCGTGSYDFGTIKIGESSSPMTFTIENLGIGNLILSGTPKIQILGTNATMFSINQSSTSSSIASGNSTTFTITFSPTAIENRSAMVSITNNDTDENPYTFTVTGFGSLYAWTKRIGGPDTDIVSSITIDSLGNTYCAGYFKGPINFGADFGVNDVKVVKGNRYDSFITKINADSTYGWTKQFSANGSTFSTIGIVSITIDSSNNIYITGGYSGIVDFAADFGGTDIFTSARFSSSFITKLNSNGTYGWTKTIGDNDYNSYYLNSSINAIITDSLDNIYIGGTFDSTVNFGKSFGVSDVRSPMGFQDIFITKLKSDGTYLWTKIIGGTYSDLINSIKFDSQSNLYLAGSFGDSIDFGADFGVSDTKTSHGELDGFVTRINQDGSYAWTKIFGGIRTDATKSMTIDSNNNIIITGYFVDSVNFKNDFGGSDIRTSAGYHDIFVTNFSNNGTYNWTKQIGNNGCESMGISVNVDSKDNILITGHFTGSVDFGVRFGVSEIKTSKGDYDVFVLKLDSNSSYCWTKQLGGISIDTIDSIVFDSSDNIYVAGTFSSTVDFGTDFDVTDPKTSAGECDGFITKILQ